MDRGGLGLIDKAEVAHQLSVSVRTINRWVVQRRLPAPLRLGRRAYWLRDQLELALRRQSRL